jgi:hypothetical protein
MIVVEVKDRVRMFDRLGIGGDIKESSAHAQMGDQRPPIIQMCENMLTTSSDFADQRALEQPRKLRRRVRRREARAQESRADDPPPLYYVASLPFDYCLPGLRAGNELDFRSHGVDPPPSIWIGNRTIASCHYDAPNNIACVAVGRRRFTLFPPEQIFNLYPGPLEPTPGGQAVSTVDFRQPDFTRFPRFREALAAGMSAELEPGDAVYVPSMCWHHVEGLSAFNALVNYWWSSAPAYIPTAMNALLHAMWTVRHFPEREPCWYDWLSHDTSKCPLYVFSAQLHDPVE